MLRDSLLHSVFDRQVREVVGVQCILRLNPPSLKMMSRVLNCFVRVLRQIRKP